MSFLYSIKMHSKRFLNSEIEEQVFILIPMPYSNFIISGQEEANIKFMYLAFHVYSENTSSFFIEYCTVYSLSFTFA